MDLHDTATADAGNGDSLTAAHAFALGMTYAALCRGEDAPPLSEEDFALAIMEPTEEERDESRRYLRDAHRTDRAPCDHCGAIHNPNAACPSAADDLPEAT